MKRKWQVLGLSAALAVGSFALRNSANIETLVDNPKIEKSDNKKVKLQFDRTSIDQKLLDARPISLRVLGGDNFSIEEKISGNSNVGNTNYWKNINYILELELISEMLEEAPEIYVDIFTQAAYDRFFNLLNSLPYNVVLDQKTLHKENGLHYSGIYGKFNIPNTDIALNFNKLERVSDDKISSFSISSDSIKLPGISYNYYIYIYYSSKLMYPAASFTSKSTISLFSNSLGIVTEAYTSNINNFNIEKIDLTSYNDRYPYKGNPTSKNLYFRMIYNWYKLFEQVEYNFQKQTIKNQASSAR